MCCEPASVTIHRVVRLGWRSARCADESVRAESEAWGEPPGMDSDGAPFETITPRPDERPGWTLARLARRIRLLGRGGSRRTGRILRTATPGRFPRRERPVRMRTRTERDSRLDL